MYKKIKQIVVEDMSFFGSFVFAGFFCLLLVFTPYFWLAFFSMVVVHILVILLRFVFPKSRPKKQKAVSFLERIDASSFPSLHASRISIIAVISWVVSPYFGLLGSCLALGVGISRVLLRKHYVVDVIVGYILGVALTLGVLAVRNLV
jgi:undecaprenyl-diphosphatase